MSLSCTSSAKLGIKPITYVHLGYIPYPNHSAGRLQGNKHVCMLSMTVWQTTLKKNVIDLKFSGNKMSVVHSRPWEMFAFYYVSDLNVCLETVKILDEIVGENLLILSLAVVS